MADTEFSTLPASTTIAATDQILLVRGGVAYRFSGTLPTIDAAGNFGFGTATPLTRVHTNVGGATANYILVGNSNNGLAVGVQAGGASAVYGYSGQVPIVFGSGIANGATPVEYARFDGTGNLLPGADNARSLGSGALRFSVVYAASGAISTSDAASKQQVGPIPDEWLDAWGDVAWVRFRFNAAVEEKGEAARWHVGLVAQQVRDAFAARGLDALAIGLLCHDAWPRTPAVKAVRAKRDAAGNVTRPAAPAVPAVPAGERWGLRYDECQAIEAAWQRRELARLAARLDALGQA